MIQIYPVLSLWQPWASLMADGRKPWETRHWPAPSRLMGKHYAIHAAMKVDRYACEDFGYDWKTIPRGVIVSIHILEKCLRFTNENIVGIEDPYGDFSEGRFGWKSPLVEKLLIPFSIKGHQGIWNWERTR